MNTGHGHVHPREDGVRMRCGGPGFCVECSREAGLAWGALVRENESLTRQLAQAKVEHDVLRERLDRLEAAQSPDWRPT